jgi:hypothetical protein
MVRATAASPLLHAFAEAIDTTLAILMLRLRQNEVFILVRSRAFDLLPLVVVVRKRLPFLSVLFLVVIFAIFFMMVLLLLASSGVHLLELFILFLVSVNQVLLVLVLWGRLLRLG